MAFRIQSKEIEYGGKLGEGGFGEVYKAKWNHTEVAVKQLALKKLSESMTKEFKKETNVHINLKHPHIVQMFGVTSEQPYGMVMEYMENGSLDSYLQQNPSDKFIWLLKYKIALDVIKGLLFLHKNSIIHRDLKSLNVLLNKSLDAKICDFGLAKLKAETMSKTGFKGTIQWAAPELFALRPVYNEKTDTYSYGIILWELASHEYPYKGTPPFSIPSLVKDGEREIFPENTPKVFEELAKKCWSGKAENRPESESVIMTLESLLASSNESKHVNTYLSPSTLNQSKESGYLQPSTNNLESTGYLNPSANNTGYINPFQSKQPHLPNSYPISTTTNNSNPFTINNSSVIKTPQPKPIALPSCAFGAAAWKNYFGDVGVEPPLPKDIDQILSSPCPFWPSKKIHETQLLVLVPKTVNGQPLTLNTLGELVKKPLTGYATQYSGLYHDKCTYAAPPLSHWVLMTRDVVEGSRGKAYKDQQKLLSQKGHDVYTVPTILDATVCIFMEYVRSENRLYSDRPHTYTRCQERFNDSCQLNVGCFGPHGLHISTSRYDGETVGVGGLRKF